MVSEYLVGRICFYAGSEGEFYHDKFDEMHYFYALGRYTKFLSRTVVPKNFVCTGKTMIFYCIGYQYAEKKLYFMYENSTLS